jgi:hypothetical protein
LSTAHPAVEFVENCDHSSDPEFMPGNPSLI